MPFVPPPNLFGSFFLTANYLGNSSPAFVPSSTAVTVQVLPASTTTSISSATNPSTAGQAVTFTATVTPQFSGTATGIVQFFDGGNFIGSSNLGGGTTIFFLPILNTGQHSITAKYQGDINFNPSTSLALTQTVNAPALKSTQTTLSSSLNPSIVGQPVNLTATVSGSGSGTPTGTVAFLDGSTTIVSGVALSAGMAMYQDASLTAGTHSLTAVYSGDANYSGSTSATLTQTVNSSSHSTTTTLVSSANPSAPGQAVTFTATVTTSGPGTPSGVITWWDGTTELGNFALNGNSASLTTSSLSLGQHSITANYGGDSVFAPSTSAVWLQQVKGSSGPGSSAAGTTSTSLTSSPNPSTPGQAVTLTATVTSNSSGAPTGSVTFEDSSNTLGSAVLSGGQASLVISSLSAGGHSITAVYSGDANFSGSTSAVLSQTVTNGASSPATYYFPHLAFGGGWQITLTYVNYGPQSNACHTTFYSDLGEPLNVPFTDGTASTRTDNLAGGAEVHVQTQSDGNTSTLTGWAEAQCTAPVKASLLYRLINNGVAQGEAGVNATSAPATEFVSFAQTATGFACANPSSGAAEVTVTVRDVNGNELGSKTLTLAPNQHSAANIGVLLGLGTFTGSVQIVSTEPIAAVFLNAEAYPVFSSLPPADLPAQTPLAGTQSTAAAESTAPTTPTTYYFAHMAFGEGWQTTLTYVNYGPGSATCQTTFYSDAGDPLNVPFADGTNPARADNLASGAEIHLETQSGASASLSTGWAKAQCTAPVKASLLYRLVNNEVAQGEAGVNATSAPATKFVSFAQTATGVAYANPSAQSADVTLTVLDVNGNQLGSKSVTLEPNQYAAANIGPLLGLGSFSGSVQIVSTQPIAVVLLNAEAYPVFSSLPPADLPSQTVLAGQSQ